MKSKNPFSTRTDFLSGLCKKDVFANFYGSFEPTNLGVLKIFILIIFATIAVIYDNFF